jgi:UDP-N-acetylmuramate dehydrogenase
MPSPLPLDALQRALDDPGAPGRTRLERNAPLAPLTTFRIGGPADLLYRARTADELAEAVQTARRLDIPWFVLGKGANLLVSDSGFKGLVIRCEVGGIEVLDDGVSVRAGAGVSTYGGAASLIEHTVSRGLAGLHHFVGIPSTVGGAMWQNLHFLSPAPTRERTCFLEEVVRSAEILTEEGRRETVGVEYFEFGYDDSILHRRRDLVLSVDFALELAPESELRRVMRENLEWRDERHPDLWLYPSVGSVFRKVEGVGAGRLVDECGLKGHVHPSGRAMIFHRHANIVVNLGGATARDVMDLIELARETVFSETGVELVPEIGFLGEF